MANKVVHHCIQNAAVPAGNQGYVALVLGSTANRQEFEWGNVPNVGYIALSGEVVADNLTLAAAFNARKFALNGEPLRLVANGADIYVVERIPTNSTATAAQFKWGTNAVKAESVFVTDGQDEVKVAVATPANQVACFAAGFAAGRLV